MMGELIEDPAAFDDDNDDVELLYRKDEMREVFDRHSPFDNPGNLLLSGPRGVGKSLFATKILDELEIREGIKRAHINCLGKTKPAIYREILEDLSVGPDEVPETRSLENLREDLIGLGDDDLVVVLDEGDDLPLSDAVDDLLLETDATLIAIAHDGQDWLSQIDHYHMRRFSHIDLEHYSVDELTHILDLRARQGFYNRGIVSDDQIKHIADETGGVAREGIQWLRAAAVVAQEREHNSVHECDLEKGEEKAMQEIRQRSLESLPFHHRVLYAIVHEGGDEIEADALHDRYEAIAEDVYDGKTPQSIGRRARRKKLKKLKSYDLIDPEGPTSDRRYQVEDQAVEPNVNLPTPVSSK